MSRDVTAGVPLLGRAVDLVLIGVPGAVLLYGGYRICPEPPLSGRLHAGRGWCRGGVAVLLGVVGLLVLNPGETIDSGVDGADRFGARERRRGAVRVRGRRGRPTRLTGSTPRTAGRVRTHETVMGLPGRSTDVSEDDPKPNEPLSPYYPSRVPDVPGSGRTWFALLLTLMMLLGAAYGVLALLFPI